VVDREYFERVEKSVAHEGVRVETIRVVGAATQEILRYAEENGFGLIAMATHGRSGITRWVYGSVADKVLHASDLPLLLVKPSRTERVLPQRRLLESLVVPLDGSELAEEALPFAEALAIRLELSITLVRVVSYPLYAYEGYEGLSYGYAPPDHKSLTEMMEASAKEYLEGVQARLRLQGHQVEAVTVLGHPASQIMDLAQRTEGSLVVMSTHGRSGFQRWVLGSVADRVLRASHRPILLVRPEAARLRAQEEAKAQSQQPSYTRGPEKTATRPAQGPAKEVVPMKMLVALDGSPIGEAVLPKAAALAASGEIEVTLVRVVKTSDLTGTWFPAIPRATYDLGEVSNRGTQASAGIAVENRDQAVDRALHEANEYLEDMAHRFFPEGARTEVLSGEEITDALLDYVRRHGVGLIAMSTHGRTGLGKLLMGSVAGNVLQARVAPVFLVRPDGLAPATS
jgi:nucleotide-binding universal stress UspA family protein